MGRRKFTNNASTTLAATISSGATSVAVVAGTGSLFPVIGGGSGDTFTATFVKQGSPGVYEIVLVTATAGDTFTIVRAQEFTAPLGWNAGDFFTLLPTAGDLQQFTQIADLQAQAPNYALDTGSVNAYAVVLTPPLIAHVVGAPIRWKASNTSTGPSTFNDGFGVANLVTPEGVQIGATQIAAGGIYESVWDGTEFQCVTIHTPEFPTDVGPGPNTIPVRDGSGNLEAEYFEQFSALENFTIGVVAVMDTVTNLWRRMSLGNFLAQIFDSAALTGVPTAPTAPPGTSDTQIATTAFVNQGGVVSGNGWHKYADGTIDQWGSFPTTANGGNVGVSFPEAFPNAVFSIVYSIVAPGGLGGAGSAQQDILSFNNAAWVFHSVSSSNPAITVMWRAIGN